MIAPYNERLHVPETPLRVLIADDEPLARNILASELASIPGTEVVGEAPNGAAALTQIAQRHPDLVLLDLEMPGVGGFEVIQNLPPGPLPVIVIVTAYDQHAIQAYEAGAADYLLKPVSRERLEKAVERARALRANRSGVAESLVRLNDLSPVQDGRRTRKVVGKLGDEYHLLDVSEVLAFQAEREIVWIVTARQRYMATQTLRAIDERLAGSVFQRVHRNCLVNVNQVRKMTPLTSQRWMLTLSNGQELIVSKRQASSVRQLLQW
jgi:DNA-binding LytR/AlgR family response regulator